MLSRKICVGKVTGAHGVRGLVRVRSFTENPEDIVAYGPLSDEVGERVFALTLKGAVKDAFIVEISGVKTREEAQALKGVPLFADRAALPETEVRQYYHADLIGLRVEDPEGQGLGAIIALHDFGGGVMLEVKPVTGASFMVPFRDAFVPVVDVAAGRVVADLPADWREPPKKDGQKDKRSMGEEA